MNEPPVPTVSELARLQMENELLNLEVGHLRTRLKTFDQLRASEARIRDRYKELQKRHDDTLHDMRRLLHRLNGSPAAPLLRRWKGFQVLLARYEVSSSK